ncbi:unnamed protein product [Echinostoma caproni]|uniref:C2H2-type domain-containing protein n=1 Tax=Echinostoma caproni TaxID=27848 RepID=A0A183AHY5_9TREM|nr:unnamed protein product [Echinostoma caproni]
MSSSNTVEQDTHSSHVSVGARGAGKRDPSTEDIRTNAPFDKRRKQQHNWISELNHINSINLSENCENLRKLDQTTAQLLLRHLQLSDWLHECAACQIYFIDQEMWLHHREQMHNRKTPDQPFVCAVCSEDLGDRLAFITHFVQNHRTDKSELHTPPVLTPAKSIQSPDLLDGDNTDSSTTVQPIVANKYTEQEEEEDEEEEGMECSSTSNRLNGSVSPQSDSCPSPSAVSRPVSKTEESSPLKQLSPVRNLPVLTDSNTMPNIISTQS